MPLEVRSEKDKDPAEVDSPVEKSTIRNRCPRKSVFLLSHQVLDNVALVLEDGHHCSHFRINGLGSKLRGDEALYACLDCCVDGGFSCVDKVWIQDANHGILALKSLHKLIFRVAAVDRDDLDMWSKCRCRSFAGKDGEVEGRIFIYCLAQRRADVSSSLCNR